ncbi:hypothetical protein PR048_032605 [Dryococelus australis]|uniref:Uncharacterized protein n=1 Tax=Dryococelus australis TaxID=614101 RepID=A0ABQ9G6S2_9NEOP|nr:hypothetical protein PR048_032605 [Dryococelus australis]
MPAYTLTGALNEMCPVKFGNDGWKQFQFHNKPLSIYLEVTEFSYDLLDNLKVTCNFCDGDRGEEQRSYRLFTVKRALLKVLLKIYVYICCMFFRLMMVQRLLYEEPLDKDWLKSFWDLSELGGYSGKLFGLAVWRAWVRIPSRGLGIVGGFQVFQLTAAYTRQKPGRNSKIVYGFKEHLRSNPVISIKLHMIERIQAKQTAVSPDMLVAYSPGAIYRVSTGLRVGWRRNAAGEMEVTSTCRLFLRLTQKKLNQDLFKKCGVAVLETRQFVLRKYSYVDALGRLDVYFTFPAPLHSIIWGFMDITGVLLRCSFQPYTTSVLRRFSGLPPIMVANGKCEVCAARKATRAAISRVASVLGSERSPSDGNVSANGALGATPTSVYSEVSPLRARRSTGNMRGHGRRFASPEASTNRNLHFLWVMRLVIADTSTILLFVASCATAALKPFPYIPEWPVYNWAIPTCLLRQGCADWCTRPSDVTALFQVEAFGKLNFFPCPKLIEKEEDFKYFHAHSLQISQAQAPAIATYLWFRVFCRRRPMQAVHAAAHTGQQTWRNDVRQLPLANARLLTHYNPSHPSIICLSGRHSSLVSVHCQLKAIHYDPSVVSPACCSIPASLQPHRLRDPNVRTRPNLSAPLRHYIAALSVLLTIYSSLQNLLMHFYISSDIGASMNSGIFPATYIFLKPCKVDNEGPQGFFYKIFWFRRSAVTERLAHSPPANTNWVQSPAGSPDFHKWESCRTMQFVGRFSQRSPVSPAPSFWRRSILTSITHIGSQDLAVKSRPNLFTHSGFES